MQIVRVSNDTKTGSKTSVYRHDITYFTQILLFTESTTTTTTTETSNPDANVSIYCDYLLSIYSITLTYIRICRL